MIDSERKKTLEESKKILKSVMDAMGKADADNVQEFDCPCGGKIKAVKCRQNNRFSIIAACNSCGFQMCVDV